MAQEYDKEALPVRIPSIHPTWCTSGRCWEVHKMHQLLCEVKPSGERALPQNQG
jgi:hypothetical protein